MKAIGLDIGTTTICGILIDAECGKVLKHFTEHNDFIASTHSWERIQDPEVIFEKAEWILSRLFEEDVVSIGVTGQMHGIVYLDQNGEVQSPLYTWQDGRGELPYENTTYAKHLNSFTGYGYVTHFYNKVNYLVPKSSTVFCTIHDYVVMRLTGRRSPIVHSSDAASFGQYDLKGNSFMITDKMLPETTDTYTVVGQYRNVPVTVAIGDNQASFIGAISGKNSVLVNVGTGSQVSVITDHISELEGIEVRPYVENKYLLVGCALCGGRAFALLESFFRKTVHMVTGDAYKSLYPQMDKMLETYADSSLVFDNRFNGTRENPGIRGSISNLSVDNFTPEQFVVGILNGMVTELYEMFEKMNVSCDTLVGSGNGIRKNKALKKMFSAKFGVTLKVPAQTEEASFGAALFSLVGAGVYPNICEAQKIINYEG